MESYVLLIQVCVIDLSIFRYMCYEMILLDIHVFVKSSYQKKKKNGSIEAQGQSYIP